MAKRKVSLDKDAMQQFFMLHGEKLGMLVVLGLLGYFVYSGMNVEGLSDDQTPDRLVAIAEQKESNVNTTNFDEFAKVRSAKPNLVEEVKGEVVMDPAAYPIVATQEPAMKPKTLRTDPPLRVAMNPHVVGTYAAIALAGPANHQEKVFDLPLAPEPEGDSRSNRREDEGTSSGPGLGFPGSFPGSGGSGFPSSGPGGASGGGSGRGGRSSGSGSSGSGSSGFPGSFPSSGESDGGSGSIGSFPGAPGLSGVTAGGRSVPMVQQNEMVGVAGRVPANTRLYNTYVVSVSYLFPHKVQWNEFESTFREAYGYSPARDIPRYLKFEVERSEDGGAWESITGRINQYPKSYATQIIDVVDPKSIDPSLTLPIPPTMLASPFELGGHPEVATRDFNAKPGTNATGEEGEAEGEEGVDPDDPFAATNRGSGGASNPYMPPGSGGSGSSMMMGNGPLGSSSGSGQGSSMMMGGRGLGLTNTPLKPESDYKLIRFFDLEAKPGKSYRYRVRVWLADPNHQEESASVAGTGGTGVGGGAALPGGPMGISSGGGGGAAADASVGGASGPGSGPGGSGSGEEGSESGMIGRPPAPIIPVDQSDLDPVVRRRIRDWKESPEFAALAEEDASLRYARATEWSVETDPIVVPETSEANVFAGPARVIDYSDAAGIRYTNDEPGAALVVSQFDMTLGTNTPAKLDVLRGSWLSFSKPSEFLNPIDMSIRTMGTKADPSEDDSEDVIEPLDFTADAFVVDVFGGNSVSLSGIRQKLVTGSEVLVVDSEGTFTITDEFEDLKEYRHALFLDDEPVVGAARGTGMSMPGGSSGPGGAGFPSMGPGGASGPGGGGFPASGPGGAGFPGSGPGGSGFPGSRPGGGRPGAPR